MKEEVLIIVCQLKDVSVNTWTETMGNHSVGTVIQRVKFLKDWMGGKFIDIHTWCDGKKFTYDVSNYQNLIDE